MNNPRNSDTNTRQLDGVRVGYLAALAVLILCGFYLRIRCLGCLGFRWDEDLTSLAVKSLMDDGIPDLPSGMIYTRFYPYQFLLAASAKLFGFSEFSIRLPGVVLSTTLIPVGYWIASKLFDRRIGLVVAAGLAFSFEQVEMARTARMYAPFFLVYTLAAYSIYCAYYKDPERVFSPWPVLLSLVALSLHQLGYSLAVLVAGAIFLNPGIKRGISLLLQGGAIGVAFIVIKSIQEHFFYRGQRLLQTGDPSSPEEQQSTSALESILNQIDAPNFDLVKQLTVAAPLPVLAIVLTGIAFAVWIVRGSDHQSRWPVLFALFAIALSVMQQFNLALFAIAGVILASGKGLFADLRGTWLRTACGSAVIFLAWVAVILTIATFGAVDMPIAETGTRKMLRALVDYPNFRLFWSFVLERPLLAPALALGIAWALDSIVRRNNRPVALFLLVAFWAPLFLNGIIDTKYEFFRYNLHVDVFYLAICSAGLLYASEVWKTVGGITEYREVSQPSSSVWILSALLVILGVNPAAAAMTSSRGYYETGYWYRLFGLDKYQDFSAPAAYVRERLRDEDRIFVLEPREYWNYIGRVDYWIISDRYQSQTFRGDEAYLDLYVAIPVLHSIDQVRAAIREPSSGNIWLLFSESDLETTPWISDDIRQFLLDLRDNTVYIGRDRETRVIYLPPDHPARSARDQDR